MESRRAKLIAEVIRYLEDLDGEDLKGSMAPPVSEEMPPVEGAEPDMAVMVAKKEPMEPGEPEVGDDLDDDELDELSKLSH